jgi:hypothetical protein
VEDIRSGRTHVIIGANDVRHIPLYTAVEAVFAGDVGMRSV